MASYDEFRTKAEAATLSHVDLDGVARSLRERTDPASRAASQCLDAGGRWWLKSYGVPGADVYVETVRTAAVRRQWSRRDLDRFNPQLRIVGRDELLADLDRSAHPRLDEVTLERVGLLNDKYVVYVAPGGSEVVACIGIETVPAPPPVVHRRDDIPTTVTAAAEAFLSHNRFGADPYVVTVHRELDDVVASQLFESFWNPRRRGPYNKGRSTTVLAAAEVSFTADVSWPGRTHEGHLLVLDLELEPKADRDWNAAVELILLTLSRGLRASVARMLYLYNREI